MDILAKPKGITLEEHTQNVVSEAQKVIAHHPFVVSKYEKLTGFSLAKRLNGAAFYHDAGKKAERWQKACQQDYEVFLKTGKVGNSLKNTNIRHEIESLKIHLKDNFSDCVKVAIAAHHAKLGERFAETRWQQQAPELWKEFLRISYDSIDKLSFKELILKNYEFAAVRGYLQLADHRASILEDGRKVPNFKEFKYEFKHEKKRNVQKLVEERWKNDLLLLRAPTGAGKTDACLLWADKQIRNGRADRLVIAMPTRFTSNALAISVTESLSDTGLYHSSAWFVKFADKVKNAREEEDLFKLEHEFAKLLETPVTVCTIDHLLMSQTHTKEHHHSTSFNLANSCLVIDEADFYDEFTQANIIELLKILKILNVPVLLMSASLPESSLEFYKQTGYTPIEICEDTVGINRPRCKIEKITQYSSVEEIDSILNKALLQPTIIYANTVARAMEFYSWFQKNKVKDVVLYHSRFTEPDKLKKENILLENLGKEAWESKKAKGIAILTQIGEMSVNISADLMLSDVCPVDRLVQRTGRLCRFSEKVGFLHLLVPQKDNVLYPAPYGRYEKGKGWITNASLEKTLNIIEEKTYSSQDFIEIVNDIYEKIGNVSDTTIINLKRYKELIRDNWLILPKQEPSEEKEETDFWKSRNITGQREVFVLHPLEYVKLFPQSKIINTGCYFKNYKEFNYYRNQYAVSYPIYALSKGIANGMVHTYENILIGFDKEPKTILVANTDTYNEKTGLNIDIINDVFL